MVNTWVAQMAMTTNVEAGLSAIVEDGLSAIVEDGLSAIVEGGLSAIVEDGLSAIVEDGLSAMGGIIDEQLHRRAALPDIFAQAPYQIEGHAAAVQKRLAHFAVGGAKGNGG